MQHPLGVGILGAGTIGGTLIRRLIDEHDVVRVKTGLDLEVRRVAVRSLDKARAFTLPDGVLSDRPDELVTADDIDLVVEVMGGIEPAGSYVLAALQAGKPVITANKELIAAEGRELLAAAEAAGVPLLFEAAVGGGIPIIRPLEETLAGEPIGRVMGIVNGTTNYILTQMTESNRPYAEALAEAQELGYAEPDPTADVSGADAASKAAILGSLAFGTWVPPAGVYSEGIERIGVEDITFAADLGFVIKLLGVSERRPEGISTRVHPVMIPDDHPLAPIRGATNAIFIEGPSIDQLLFAGPGAGGDPTATAVLGDVIDAAREILAEAQVSPRIRFAPGALMDFGDVPTCWYIRLEVADRPGVLAQIAGAFGEADVSIRSVWQDGRGDRATLLLVTHEAPERAQRAAVDSLRGLDVVAEVASVIRVESDES